MTKAKVIVICGQTSTGKSDFAVALAKKIKSTEIISADSRQVYIGLDIGSGKITPKEMQGIPHHMLDVAKPNKVFTVAQYKKLADKKIREIIKNGNIPIICGGTGFYIDAIINDITLPQVPPNKKLRIELENKTASELFNILKKLDPTRAQNIDSKNPVRLIRAIEIATALGSVPNANPTCGKYDVLKIGLNLADEVLKERIYKRIIKRIKGGMIDEVMDLHNNGLSWARMGDLGLEYRYISQYLQEKIDNESRPSQMLRRAKMIDKLNKETWQYAKRQKTWFKRDRNTIWINPLNKVEIKNTFTKVKEFLG